jgi:SnoaL-like protein
MDTTSEIRTIADRVAIEALRGEFTDAGMMADFDRLASLFTANGVLRIPGAAEFVTREEIGAGIARLRAGWEYFVQNVHPGVIQLDGDTATGRAYVAEFGRFLGGQSHLNYALYHDRYERTPDGWKFAERVYEVRYVDNTPLTGSPA